MITGNIHRIETDRFFRYNLKDRLLMVDDDMQMSALPSTGYLKNLVTAEIPIDVEAKGKQSEQYSAQVYEIDGQIRMLNRKLEKSPEKKDPITLRLKELAEIFENYDGSEKAQAAVLETAIQKIIICEDRTIHFQLFYGLELVERIKTYEGY